MAIVAEEAVMLKAVGTLHTEISTSVQNNILTRVLPASLLNILLASIISTLLVARIVKPILELTKGAEEIGRGNLDYNISTASKNEIGALAISFNQMSQALKKSRQELYEYSHSLEEKVRERTQNLTEANIRQENLLHFVSHDVKAHLTNSMYAFASITEDDFGPVPPELKKMAEGALSDMRDGMATVIDILDADNLKNGVITYNKKPFDFREALQDTIKQLQFSADKKALALDIVTGAEPFILTGDKEKISQHVIRNIIDNAIQYTPKGAVRIELTHEGNVMRFAVTDSGIGITTEDMARLFTEGGKGTESSKINIHSTGYGLFVAKMVVNAHDGKIWAESEGAGKGARFFVEFPTA